MKLKDFIRSSYHQEASELKMTTYSVQFEFSLAGCNAIHVDLLVSPYFCSDAPQDFYRLLKSLPRKKAKNVLTFSVSASKWQVKFVKDQPPVVKEYIRRAKAWRNATWKPGMNGRPKSYLLTLLVVRAYEHSGHMGPAGVTRALIGLVKTPKKKLNVYWTNNYERRDYPTLLPPRSRVIDPANPANNVWRTGFSGDCSVLVCKIDTIDLSQPV